MSINRSIIGRAMAVLAAILAMGSVAGGFASKAAAQAADGTSEVRLHHVGISVPDAEAAAAWYQNMLGFEEVARVSDPTVPTDVIHVMRDNVRIELFEVPNSAPAPEYRSDPTEDLRTQGVKHFGLHVDDVKGMLAELEAKGVTASKQLVETPGVIFVFINDNNGNPVELIQMKQ